MAQRKPPSNRSAPGKGSSRPAGKPGAAKSSGSSSAKVSLDKPAAKSAASSSTSKSSAKPAAAKPAAVKSTAAKSAAKRPAAASGRPPARKKPKSIVNQKQTPWGLIVTTAVVVLFAAAVVIVVIATHKSDKDKSASTSRGGQTVKASDPYRQPEFAAAEKIKGLTYRVEAQHNHTDGKIKYDATPPIGGLHNAYWADCTGTVYKNAIANENAVHMLEHGAIWVTYNANDVKGAQLATLKKYVAGVDRMALSPYPNLSTPISLQAWGYQLKVNSASDPRIKQFIDTLKNNKKTTPEYGAVCSNPGFKSDPSTFGNPKGP